MAQYMTGKENKLSSRKAKERLEARCWYNYSRNETQALSEELHNMYGRIVNVPGHNTFKSKILFISSGRFVSYWTGHAVGTQYLRQCKMCWWVASSCLSSWLDRELVAGRVLCPTSLLQAGGPQEVWWPSPCLRAAWAPRAGWGASGLVMHPCTGVAVDWDHVAHLGSDLRSRHAAPWLFPLLGKTSLQLLREMFPSSSRLVSSWVTISFLLLPMAPLWAGLHLATWCWLCPCPLWQTWWWFLPGLGAVLLQGDLGISRAKG